MRKTLLITIALFIGALSANAQCEDWVSPTDSTGWGDFDLVPCNGESQEITAFEVWQSEAYAFEGCITGGTYTFSHCNGASGTWVPEYTIIAPSGAIDAFGAGDGDGCSITWTASEDGTYLVVINEAGNCGVEGSDNNGFPMIMTVSGGEECEEGPVFVEGAESFEGGGIPECWMAVDEDGDGFNWNIFEGIAFEGDFSIRSESWDPDQGPLTPDNYLITPQCTLGEGDSLYYVITAVDPDFAAENYSVLVSTTGNDIADFTDEVFTENLDEVVDWAGRSIDLSAYNNQSIYIAFRHHNVTDQFWFGIDAVALPGEVNLDCAMSTEELSQLEDVSIFPNPNNGDFSIINNGTADFFTLNIFDVTGKMVSQENVQLNTGTIHEVDLTNQPSGLYTLQFVSETQAGSFKVIVQ